MSDLDKIRNDKGELPAYAWPGGYQMFYLDAENSVLCPKCANEPEDHEAFRPVAHGVNWEDDSLYCDACSERIPSAYGEGE